MSEKIKYSLLILLHIVIGMIGNYASELVGIIFLLIFIAFAIDVVVNADKGMRAGFYALYFVGFETVYRVAGSTFSHELGKYLSILILLIGLIINRRKSISWVFIFGLVLLIPAMFLVENPDPIRIRKMILFNMSGPLCIVFSGLYYFNAVIDKETLFKQFRIAFLPAFSLVVLLSLKADLDTVDFTSVSSNMSAGGGFSPNQVSSALGWFVFLVLVVKLQGKNITLYNWIDFVMLAILMVRGLLTFSRGGMLTGFFAVIASFVVYFINEKKFRNKVIKQIPYFILGISFMVIAFIYANRLTGNYLLYRYQGKTTTEVVTGKTDVNKSLLTGRGDLMEGDLAAFKAYPILGVGYGMAMVWHERYFGRAAAHTEYTRQLSEHGILGLVFMLILFIVVPVKKFFNTNNSISKYIMVGFLMISFLTMFHAAMRMALPGIAYGASLIFVNDKRYNRKNTLKE